MTLIVRIIADKIRANPHNPRHQRSHLRSKYRAEGAGKKKHTLIAPIPLSTAPVISHTPFRSCHPCS
jgi:hypothetical protein